jgi:hypothetical protein
VKGYPRDDRPAASRYAARSFGERADEACTHRRPPKPHLTTHENLERFLTVATRRQIPRLVEEHIASRKEWGRYVNVTTLLHRADADRASDFLAQMRARIRQAKGLHR